MPRRMTIQLLSACFLVFAIGSSAIADETLYRYEGNVLPYDVSAGWEIFDPCEPPCSESVEDGHFVLHWTVANNFTNYTLEIGREPETSPP